MELLRFSRPALVALCLCGCVTTPTTRQTARTVSPQELRLGAGASLPISTRFVSEVVDLASGAVDRATAARDAGRPLTEEEQRELESQALAILLFTVMPVFELDARYGVVDDLDLGLRLSGAAARLDAKWRFLETDGLELAGLLGYSYHFGLGTSVVEEFHDLFDITAVAESSRHDVDVAVLASGIERDERLLVPYGGVRYLASFNSLTTEFHTSFLLDTMSPRTVTTAVMHVISGVGGLRLGTRRFALQLELSVAYVFLEPEFGGRTYDLSGLIFTPALGLSFETG